jgi:hypothetical protein
MAFSPLCIPVSSSGLRENEGQAKCQHANAPPRQVPGRVVIVTGIAPNRPRNAGVNAATTGTQLSMRRQTVRCNKV